MLQIRHPAPYDIDHAHDIYSASFPVEEQRPWEKIIHASSGSVPELNGIYEGKRLAGIVTVWHFPRFKYIEHLAIDAELRGHGIGADTLRILCDRYHPLPILIEVEPEPTSDIAARRISFYRRNGFEIIGRDYIQPSYAPGLPEVALWLMSTAPLDPGIATKILHCEVYKQ